MALLSHQGKQTAYAADNVQAAVDAAVEGDTIQLSNGPFKPFICIVVISIKCALIVRAAVITFHFKSIVVIK